MAVKIKKLLPFLEETYDLYHKADYLSTDPLLNVHRFKDKKDREIVAFFSAFLAYGNVTQINKSIAKLLVAMDNQPYDFIYNLDNCAAGELLNGFKHRFTDEEDILYICFALQKIYRSYGSLEDLFLSGYNERNTDLQNAAAHFIDFFSSSDAAVQGRNEIMRQKSSFKHFLPSPARGSACKRLWLFLRWVCRPDDGIDLKIWSRVPHSKLLMPIDTHIFRIGKNLGLITTSTPNQRAALEMTENLRKLNPADPIKYDFSLCRIGILKQCPSKSELKICNECGFKPVCLTRRALEG